MGSQQKYCTLPGRSSCVSVCVCVCVLRNHVIYTVVMRYSTLISLNSCFSTNDFPLFFWWLGRGWMASLHLKGSRLIQFVPYRGPSSTRIFHQFPADYCFFLLPTHIPTATHTSHRLTNRFPRDWWLGPGAMLSLVRSQQQVKMHRYVFSWLPLRSFKLKSTTT